MKNKDFDQTARNALSYDPGGPSERVWQKIESSRRADRLPSGREILISGFASAAALLVAWLFITGRSFEAPLVLDHSEPSPVFQAAIRDDARLTLAAITNIEGM